MAKIRVGLLVDDLNVPFWEYKMIERISAGNYAEIVLVVQKKSAGQEKLSFIARVKKNINVFLFKIYLRIEDYFQVPGPDAFALKNIEELTAKAAFMEVDCIEKKYSDYFHKADIEKIREQKIDVFLRMGFRILRGDILKAAKMGIWSYHHGDNFKYRGGPAGYWEYLKQEREVGSILQILTEDLDGGIVLYRSWSAIASTAKKTINNFFWKTSLFVPRKLKELYETGESSFWEKVKCDNKELHFYSAPNYTTPTNSRFLKLIFPILWKRIRNKFWKLFNFEQWILLYAFHPDTGPSASAYRYRRIFPPKDRFWADPCVVYEKERHYVFFEELIYKENGGRGHICVTELNKKGEMTEPVIILKQPYHLSYPNVFRYNDEYYLIPESQESGTIQLYKAVNFPYEWEFKMNLMENVRAVDATIIQKDDRVWLFANIQELDGVSSCEELFLFSSDDLLSGNWTPHPLNPVVSDVKSSRPAGRIFCHNNKLYRPSQDCSYRYGYATIINEIQVLNAEEYREKRVSAITPDWDSDILGTHSISFENGLSVIDAIVKRKK